MTTGTRRLRKSPAISYARLACEVNAAAPTRSRERQRRVVWHPYVLIEDRDLPLGRRQRRHGQQPERLPDPVAIPVAFLGVRQTHQRV